MVLQINRPAYLVSRAGLFCLAAALVILSSLPASTTALPLTDVVERAMSVAKGQSLHHRARRAAEITNCALPENLEQMFQDLNSGISSTQFLRPAGSNGQTISYPTGEKGRLIPIPGADTTCPTKVQVDENASVASRSLCPFYNDILVMPEGYYPPTFLYAKCKCTDCIENDAYGCEPVSYKVAVLKPSGCSNGLQLYEEIQIDLHTSCTCAARGRNVEADSITTTTPGCTGQECF